MNTHRSFLHEQLISNLQTFLTKIIKSHQEKSSKNTRRTNLPKSNILIQNSVNNSAHKHSKPE